MSLQPQQPGNQLPGVSPLTGYAPPLETRFKPGNRANPSGVPKTVSLAKKLAAHSTPEIIKRMIKIALEAEEKYAIPAAALVIERALGKAPTMRELYPLKQDADTGAASGLTDEQSARIYSILKEGKNA